VAIDALQKISCDNIKAAGIVVYTVQVNTDRDPTSMLLQQCASPETVELKAPKFLLTSGRQIVTAFNTIGTSCP